MNSTLERFLQPLSSRSGQPPSVVATLLERFFTHLEVAAERRRLASLDEHILQDLGISRADALAESARSFWDLPPDR